MQADVSVNHCVAERLVGGIRGHFGLGPVVGKVERCREETQNDESAGKRKICDLFNGSDKNTKLTDYHHSYEQTDNYSTQPEQPLMGR